MFAKQPSSPYDALRNIKKSKNSVSLSSKFLSDLAKRQREGLNDPNYLRKIINRAITPLPVLEYDECNIYVTTWYGFFVIRNPNCSPNIMPPYEVGINDSPFVPSPRATGIYVFVSKGYQKYYDRFNNGTAFSDARREWNHTFISALFPDNKQPPNANRGEFTINYRSSNYLDVSWDRNTTPSITNQQMTLSFLRATNNFISIYREGGSAALANFTTMAAGLNYQQALDYANGITGDGKNVYFYQAIDRGFGDYSINEYKRTYKVIEIGAQYIEPPPPPKKKKRDKEMCCDECRANTQLLQLILKRIGALPVDVPSSFLTKNGTQPTALQSKPSLTTLITWFASRLDEVIGEFEITIDIEDTDLTQSGNQSKTIRLPNLSEAIAELFSLSIQANINNELILNIANRTLIESGQIKQSDYKIYSALMALIDYIGFPTKSTVEEMPLTFTPGEKTFDKVLKDSKQKVSVLDYVEKETLVAKMQALLQAAAITRAVHYRRLPGGHIGNAAILKQDLKELLDGAGDLGRNIQDYLNSLEKGYSDNAGGS